MPDGVIYLAEDDTIEVDESDGRAALRPRPPQGPAHGLARPQVRQPEFVRYLAGREYAEPLVMRSLRRRERSLQVQVIGFAGNRRMVLSRDVSQLERLETMRRDFVSNVSHELRTR